MKTTIVNLTPHDLNMVDTGVTYPRIEVSEGRFLTIRASQTSEEVGEVNGHVISKSTFGKPYFCTVDAKGQDEQPYKGVIPDGDCFVVSMISLQAIKEFKGVVHTTPGDNKEALEERQFLSSGKLIRDTEGKIIGSTGFSIL